MMEGDCKAHIHDAGSTRHMIATWSERRTGVVANEVCTCSSRRLVKSTAVCTRVHHIANGSPFPGTQGRVCERGACSERAAAAGIQHRFSKGLISCKAAVRLTRFLARYSI